MKPTTLLLAVALAAAGCDTLGRAAIDLTGAEVAVGGAVPADFPLPIPAGAEVTATVDVRVAGVRTTTVQLAPPPALSDEALLLEVARAMEAQGSAAPIWSDGPTGRSVSARGPGGRATSASLGTEGGKRVLTLVSIAR